MLANAVNCWKICQLVTSGEETLCVPRYAVVGAWTLQGVQGIFMELIHMTQDWQGGLLKLQLEAKRDFLQHLKCPCRLVLGDMSCSLSTSNKRRIHVFFWCSQQLLLQWDISKINNFWFTKFTYTFETFKCIDLAETEKRNSPALFLQSARTWREIVRDFHIKKWFCSSLGLRLNPYPGRHGPHSASFSWSPGVMTVARKKPSQSLCRLHIW